MPVDFDKIETKRKWEQELFYGRIDNDEMYAIELYLQGETPMSTTFIDEESISIGYGKMDGGIGVWQYDLPLSFRKEQNIYGGCRTWDEFFEYKHKEQRRKKLNRILNIE